LPVITIAKHTIAGVLKELRLSSLQRPADRLLRGFGQHSGLGQSLALRKLGGTIQDNAQTHQGSRGAGGALSNGIAHAIAVEAEDSMIKGNGRVVHERSHCSSLGPIAWGSNREKPARRQKLLS
jgi:hypothetical protein